MDFISKNPGLQHISEEIFLNLDHKSLLNCQKVNHFWENTLNDNPLFWLKKCLRIGLSKEVEPKWIELIRTSKTENQKIIVSSTLKMIHAGESLKDENFDENEIPTLESFNFDKNLELHDIMLRTWEKPKITELIYQAASEGKSEDMKKLVAFAEDTNALDVDGKTTLREAITSILFQFWLQLLAQDLGLD